MMTQVEWDAELEAMRKHGAFKIEIAKSVAAIAREHGMDATETVDALEGIRMVLLRAASNADYHRSVAVQVEEAQQ